jgi:hypothetical protein
MATSDIEILTQSLCGLGKGLSSYWKCRWYREIDDVYLGSSIKDVIGGYAASGAVGIISLLAAIFFLCIAADIWSKSIGEALIVGAISAFFLLIVGLAKLRMSQYSKVAIKVISLARNFSALTGWGLVVLLSFDEDKLRTVAEEHLVLLAKHKMRRERENTREGVVDLLPDAELMRAEFRQAFNTFRSMELLGTHDEMSWTIYFDRAKAELDAEKAQSATATVS